MSKVHNARIIHVLVPLHRVIAGHHRQYQVTRTASLHDFTV